MIQIMAYPSPPDTIARKAGKAIYGTEVGSLRRSELWRLANAWGAKFPVGATKDLMLPFFIQLENEGKDPFRPPSSIPRHAAHTEENHTEQGDIEVDFGGEKVVANLVDTGEVSKEASKYGGHRVYLPEPTPEPELSFEDKLKALPHYKLKQFCREKGIKQSNKDRKQDLVARIMDAIEGDKNDEQNIPDGS